MLSAQQSARSFRITAALLGLVGIVLAALGPVQFASAIPSGYHSGITIYMLFMVPFYGTLTSLDAFEAVAFQLIQLVGLSFGGTAGSSAGPNSAAPDYWLYAAMPAYTLLFTATAYLA